MGDGEGERRGEQKRGGETDKEREGRGEETEMEVMGRQIACKQASYCSCQQKDTWLH